MKNFLKKLFLTSSFLLVLFSVAYAQSDSYTVLAPLPCIPTPPAVTCAEGDLPTTVSFKTYVQYAINLMIALAAVSAVVMLIFGGLKYMTSVSFPGKSDGKDMMQNAIYGLLLVLSSFLILQTIDPRLVKIPTTLVPKIELKTSLNKKSDFFAELEKEASRLRAETAADIAAREQAKKTVFELEKEYADLEKEYYQAVVDGDTAKQDQLQAQMMAKSNEIKKVEAEVVYNRYKGMIDGTLSSVYNTRDINGKPDLSGENLKTVQDKLSVVKKAYSTAKSSLTTLGNPTEQTQKLNESYYKAYSDLVLMENAYNLNGGQARQYPYSAISNIQNVVKEASPHLTAEQKTNLEYNANTQIKQLEAIGGRNSGTYKPPTRWGS